jgi:predicted phage terminase large subunit-like protein
MSLLSTGAKRAAARTSLIEFAKTTYNMYDPSWFHYEMAKALERLNNPDNRENLMIFAPPQHGKSELVCIRRPAWALGLDPSKHFIATAYGDKLATTFSKSIRRTLETPQYQAVFPLKLKTRGDTTWEVERENDDQRPSFVASGIMSSITGIGATDLLVDDPVKNAEEAYSKVYRNKVWDNYVTAAGTRLTQSGKKCLVMTRWHEDDLAGRLLKKAVEDKKADQWLVLVLAATNDQGKDSYIWNTRTGWKQYFPAYQALWPEKKGREFLDQQKANLGSVYWEAMYMQRPSAPAGGIFKRENWQYYDRWPEMSQIVQIYDCATAEGTDNDYSASITGGCGREGFPILDAWRDKLSFPFLVQRVYERFAESAQLYGRFPSRVLVEDKSAGRQLLQQLASNNACGAWVYPDGILRQVPVLPILGLPATQSKTLRAMGICGYHEAKTISLPRGGSWVEDFVDEHALFPGDLHDDWVDCLVHLMTYWTRPVEDQEQIIHTEEEISISPEMDEFEMRNSW